MNWQILAAIPLIWQLIIALLVLASKRSQLIAKSLAPRSGYNGAELLEKYVRIHPEVNLQVDKPIRQVALANKRVLLVNRQLIYKKDLYTLLEIIINLKLTYKEYAALQTGYLFALLFALQSLLVVLFILSGDLVVICAGALLFIITVFAARDQYLSSDKLYTDVLNTSVDLLDLNAAETEIVKITLAARRRQVYNYPIQAITLPVRFLLPGWYN